MAFTYDLTTDLGKLRLRIGDNVSTDVILQDDELQTVLDVTTDEALSTVKAIRLAMGVLARKIAVSGAGLSASAQMKFDQYERLLGQWEPQLASDGGGVELKAGGVSKSTNEAHLTDSDFVGAQFSVGMGDNDWVGKSSVSNRTGDD